MTLIEICKWYASISGIAACFMVSLDLGRRLTGWGFALFVSSSIGWITGALLSSDEPLLTQNAVLICINCFGVYRYLIRKRAPRYDD
jgi:hypothetical protein